MTQQEDFLRLARQLGVGVEAPFFLRHEGENVRFDAYLPDFGGPKGMVIVLDGKTLDCQEYQVARSAGYYFSALNGSAEISEADVRETLNDWGFFGEDTLRPAWYTGKSWS